MQVVSLHLHGHTHEMLRHMCRAELPEEVVELEEKEAAVFGGVGVAGLDRLSLSHGATV